jgi:hypothetical protein
MAYLELEQDPAMILQPGVDPLAIGENLVRDFSAFLGLEAGNVCSLLTTEF